MEKFDIKPKSKNLIKGKSGEKIAARFLKGRGFIILYKNYKTNLGEIDLIAHDKDTLVFIEVKTRSSDMCGTPAESVTYFKQRKIAQVAAQFLAKHQLHDAFVRFDVVAVYTDNRVEHIENAFDSYLKY